MNAERAILGLTAYFLVSWYYEANMHMEEQTADITKKPIGATKQVNRTQTTKVATSNGMDVMKDDSGNVRYGTHTKAV